MSLTSAPPTLRFQAVVEVQSEEMGRNAQGAKLPMDKCREIIRLHELGRNLLDDNYIDGKTLKTTAR